MKRIAIIGPAYPLRGGLATFNQRLANQFIGEGNACEIISFSLQYPGLLFPGTTQYSDEAPPGGIVIHTKINSINPLNWWQVGNWLKNQRYDIIIVRYWLPFMGPALGTILRLVKKGGYSTIICIADNVIPHEKRPGDKQFTRYFLKTCDAFITMSEKVLSDLRLFETHKPARFVQHPLYDNFGEKIDKQAARTKLGLSQTKKIILFFGFIRAYKGLDLLLEAMATARIKEEAITLLVAGEFYEDARRYLDLIEKLGIQSQVELKTVFIPDSEVKFYLCAADAVIQPYRTATQSGVTPLAYHFEKPMVVTNVGGLPALVPHLKCGIVCEPQPEAIAAAILQFYELGEAHFVPHLQLEKLKYAWTNITKAVWDLSEQLAAHNT